MRQIRQQHRIGRYLWRRRHVDGWTEFLHEIHYRYVYDHDGD